MSKLEIIESRMSDGTPFTYGALCRLPGLHRDDDRLPDKTIQKWRRKGWIAYERIGRDTIWSLTDAGRTMLAARSEKP